MTDIVKEFNMTDLLGMLVPGSAVAFLLDKEFSIINKLETLTDANFSSGVLISLLIIAGYFLGMLLHEIGDLIERVLWWFPGFNPRLYAVYTTKLNNQPVMEPTEKTSIIRILLCSLISLFFAFLLTIKGLAIIDLSNYNWFCLLLLLFATIVGYLFILAMNRNSISKSTSNREEKQNWFFMFCIILSCLVSFFNRFSTANQKAWYYCRFNKPLSYSIWKVDSNNDEYVRMVLRKLDLFDGFRTAARNLLVTFMLIGLYASKTNGILSTMRTSILQKPEFLTIVLIVLGVLVWRYYHFSYLRFKYCYEDYLHLQSKTIPSSGCAYEPDNSTANED